MIRAERREVFQGFGEGREGGAVATGVVGEGGAGGEGEAVLLEVELEVLVGIEEGGQGAETRGLAGQDGGGRGGEAEAG